MLLLNLIFHLVLSILDGLIKALPADILNAKIADPVEGTCQRVLIGLCGNHDFQCSGIELCLSDRVDLRQAVMLDVCRTGPFRLQ